MTRITELHMKNAARASREKEREARFPRHPLQRAPTNSPRGRTQEFGYRKLSAKIIRAAVQDAVSAKKASVRLEALLWLVCSPACQLMLDYLELPEGAHLIKTGALLDNGLATKIYMQDQENL